MRGARAVRACAGSQVCGVGQSGKGAWRAGAGSGRYGRQCSVCVCAVVVVRACAGVRVVRGRVLCYAGAVAACGVRSARVRWW